jgi:hypothetical protein
VCDHSAYRISCFSFLSAKKKWEIVRWIHSSQQSVLLNELISLPKHVLWEIKCNYCSEVSTLSKSSSE